jgi:apolipoprotein N-acyltransferase
VIWAALAGGTLAASLPPLGWWPLGPAGAALLTLALRDQPMPARTLTGAVAGVALFVPGLAWMAPFTVPGYVAAVALQVGFLAVAAGAVPPGRGRLLAVPAVLVLAEAARSRWPFGGLPLAGPALGQVSGPLAPAAAVVGALGLVALMAAAGVALIAARTRRGALVAVGVLAGVAAVVGIGSFGPGGQPAGSLAVAAVQGGGPRGVPGIRADFDAVFARQLAASQQLRQPVDLVLWPEGVVDVDGPVDGSPADATLRRLARQLGATVVAGVTESVGADRFRNAAVAWSPQGLPVARYDKVHRVPFGEYAPGRRLLARVADLSLLPRDAIPGRGPGLLATPAGDLAVLISYEVFFADRARAALQAGGQVLAVPTNASSYTSAQVPAQEVAAARLRAIETGRAVVQAAPTGYSALVDPTGRLVAQSGLGGPAVLQGILPLPTGRTFYSRVGDGPILLLALLALSVAWLYALWRPSQAAPTRPRAQRRLRFGRSAAARVAGVRRPGVLPVMELANLSFLRRHNSPGQPLRLR